MAMLSLAVNFASREAAGQELGQHLAARGIDPDIVLGLPRGGVVVAAEVARILRRPLSVLVVRKVGHPHYREYAIGALAENDVELFDQAALQESGFTGDELGRVMAEETGRLREYQARFHRADEVPLAGKSVLIIDDGVATGATAEAAVHSAKKQKARQVILATPVASPEAVSRLRAVADEVVALIANPGFSAVGQYYDHFPQTSDAEVLDLLHPHA